VRGLFGDDFARHGAPLLPSERHNADGTASRAGAEVLRAGLAAAAAAHLPEWDKALTPHVLRHFCASQLYLGGMDLLAIQEALGHAWVATTMGYVNSQELHRPGEKPQVSRVTGSPERRSDRPDASPVTWEDPASIPSDA
jgi:integrase/recombinase XerD